MSSTDTNPPFSGRAVGRGTAWDGQSFDRQDTGSRDGHDRRDAHRQSRHNHDRSHDRDTWRQSSTPGFAAPGFLARCEQWLDARGRMAWIAAMVLGFIVFWPIGLALLAYMIWSKRMSSNFPSAGRATWSRGFGCANRHQAMHAARAAMRPSGNSAFDSYKSETLRRLEEEQSSFEDFLTRLRDAKDKAEFDQFMNDRAQSRPEAGSESGRESGRESGPHSGDQGDAAPEPDRGPDRR